MSLVAVWVAVSGLGVLISALLVSESWTDIRDLGDHANGRRLMARSRLIREGMRLTVSWLWMLVGVSIMLDVDLADGTVIWALLYGNFGLVLNSLVDAQTRSLVYRHRRGDEA